MTNARYCGSDFQRSFRLLHLNIIIFRPSTRKFDVLQYYTVQHVDCIKLQIDPQMCYNKLKFVKSKTKIKLEPQQKM